MLGRARLTEGSVVKALVLLAAVAAAAKPSLAPAQTAASAVGAQSVRPSDFTLVQQQPETIYAPPRARSEEEGVNEGAVSLDLTVRYMTDYVYRGIDFSEVGGSEDAPNLQIDAKISFDLGKLPHPFIGVFVNYYDSDPISQFQEIRPNVGFDWPIKPLTFSAGYNSYIYPDRDTNSTSEVFGRIEMDDSFLWSTPRPILSPYVYAAYDIDLYNGWYFEAGLKHTFYFEETGLSLTVLGDVAYVLGHEQFLIAGPDSDEDADGFQHYDVGMIADYSLNNLLNISRRYGQFSLQGYLFYTDNIDDDLIGDTQIWGGVGIKFRD